MASNEKDKILGYVEYLSNNYREDILCIVDGKLLYLHQFLSDKIPRGASEHPLVHIQRMHMILLTTLSLV